VSQPYDATTATTLFTNTIFQGKNILILWEHTNIQSLTNQLVQCNEYINNNPDPNITQSQAISNLTSDPTGSIYLYNVTINPTTHTYIETANVSTKNWWINNTIVPKDSEYAGNLTPQNSAGYVTQTGTTYVGYIQGLLSGQDAYVWPIPYVDYSQVLPSWNTDNYNMVFWLYQQQPPNPAKYNLQMTYFIENVTTCYTTQCDLIVGAIQYSNCSSEPDWNNAYSGNSNCQVPTETPSDPLQL
jgi:hypothetical protein